MGLTSLHVRQLAAGFITLSGEDAPTLSDEARLKVMGSLYLFAGLLDARECELSEWKPMPQSWAVNVRVDGRDILTVSDSALSGREDAAEYAHAIRHCADHLLGFVGQTRAGAKPMERLARQRLVADWCAAAFGDEHAKCIEQRGIRLAEEAIEAAQAAGCDRDMVHRLVDHIYDKPVGELSAELGGVGVTLVALANAADLDADECEVREVKRILSKPLDHFAKRNAAKNAAGFNVIGPKAQ